MGVSMSHEGNDWIEEKELEEVDMFQCGVCTEVEHGHGNNGQPLVEGQVCDTCNGLVLLERIRRVEQSEWWNNQVGQDPQPYPSEKDFDDIMELNRKLIELGSNRDKFLESDHSDEELYEFYWNYKLDKKNLLTKIQTLVDKLVKNLGEPHG